jgi:prolipoprotein diacylglyceryltransferase
MILNYIHWNPDPEIIGMPTTKPWGFVFERVDSIPRHPAQIYKALSYFLIFAIMILLYKKLGLKWFSKVSASHQLSITVHRNACLTGRQSACTPQLFVLQDRCV